MIIDVTAIVTDYRGAPLKEAADGTDLTVRDGIVGALNNFMPHEQPSGEEKTRAYKLSHRVMSDDKVELSLEEATFIKARSAIMHAPLLYGRLCDVLDPPPEPEPEPEPEPGSDSQQADDADAGVE